MKFKYFRDSFASFCKRAFSLVELMVTLIVVSCIITALTPAITKRLKSQAITVGSGGGKADLEFEQDCTAFGVDCALCFDDRCALCAKSCEDDEFVNTPQCICESCTTKSENCITCSSKACTKCSIGYGLSPLKICKECQETEYSDGTFPCTTCPINHYCDGVNKNACSADSWASEGSVDCLPCTDILANCSKCKPGECLECKKGYKLKQQDDGSYTCILAKGSQVFNAAGTYDFTVPEGVEELSVTLVSGGAGGGGGRLKENYKDFTTAGTTTWTVPAVARGSSIKFSSVGGGGGGAWDGGSGCPAKVTANPTGGYGLKNVSINVPANTTSLRIVVGAAGGSKCTKAWWGELKWYGGYQGGNTYIETYTSTSLVAKGGTGGTASWSGMGTAWGCSATGGSGAIADNIFPSLGISRGGAGQAGAMRIYWYDKYAGTGGGAGHIVPKQKIAVTEGEAFTVIVGAGGAGGAVGKNGVGADASMVSKFIDSSGITLLSSAPSVSTMGATGGSYNSTTVGTAGWVNGGMTATQITMDGFLSTDGGAVSGNTGGNGGTTTIEGLQTLCSAGVGGSGIDQNGTDATGFGGCGGGGAGAGGVGGAGAPGYVKISWGDE